MENGLNLGVIYLDGIWLSGWKESWEGLLAVTDISTSWAEVVFNVKGWLEIQTKVVMLEICVVISKLEEYYDC